MPPPDSSLRPLQAFHLAPESEVVERLLPAARLPPDAVARAFARAIGLIKALRSDDEERGGWNGLLHEFRLSSTEGILLLGMAEALLRIPDPATAKALLAEKLGAGDWASHLRSDTSLLASAAAWGLTLGGRICPAPGGADGTPRLQRIEALIRRLGAPLMHQALTRAMGMMADHFILGRDLDGALRRAAPPWRYAFDMLGEAALTHGDAQRYRDAYADAIGTLAQGAPPGETMADRAGISVKLSRWHFTRAGTRSCGWFESQAADLPRPQAILRSSLAGRQFAPAAGPPSGCHAALRVSM